MKRALTHAAIAAGFLAVGWTAGKAQYSEADFELAIQGSPGQTVITCLRGCDLFWVERGGPGGGADPKPTFQFSCSGGGVQQCNSGRIGGWIRK